MHETAPARPDPSLSCLFLKVATHPVGGLEIDTHQEQQRPQEALRLAQRQPEDKPERQRRLDRLIRELPLPARLTARRRSPHVGGVGGEPQRHVASLDECSLVLRPISDALFRFVRGINPRLHLTRSCPADRQDGQGTEVAYCTLAQESCTNAKEGWHSHLDGRQGPLDGQRLHRAAVAIAHVRVLYLSEFATGAQARTGIGGWMDFYDRRRPHSALNDRTPEEAYTHGGADRSPGLRPVSCQPKVA